jgi:P-type E1-E2 ATPase
LVDPPRPKAAATVRACLEAGLRVVLLTGDRPSAAEAAGRDVGILRGASETADKVAARRRVPLARQGLFSGASPARLV